MNLEEKIKKILTKRGWSVRKLCRTIGMTEANMYRIFKKDSIKTETLQKISEALNVPMVYFFSDGATLENANEQNKMQKELDHYKEKVLMLEAQLRDKEKIIELLATKA